MAIQEEGEGAGSADAPLTVGLALGGSKSSTYVFRWALAKFANGKDKPAPIFKLIHVLTPVLAVPTPLGNYIPIDEVRPDIAEAYAKEVHVQAQEMLLPYRKMCDENKVEVEVLLVKGDDVADTISNLVTQYKIRVLVVGNPTSRSAFTRKSSGNKASSKICKSIPSFCTTYIVSKDGLSSVYSPGLGSETSSCRSSDSQAFSGEMSLRSDLSDSSARTLLGLLSLPSSNLASENLKSSSSAERNRSFTLYDYISGSASVYADKDRRITSCTDSESSISSRLRASNKAPTQGSSLRGLMLSETKDDVNIELEKLRLELRHVQGAHKLVQDESADASRQVVELAAKRVEGKAQLREIQSRVDKANDEVQEEKARRCATEEVVTHVKDLVRAEVMQKNRLLIKASKVADQKSRLEELFVLHGNSYSTFTWEEIDNATSSFSESRKIGAGSNGTVYKGHLNHLDVAIKVLHSDDRSSTKHFNQELEVLGRIRHPHLLMLLGACPDRGCLVYEYMENGSLADRLQCKNGTPSIPWFHRFRIAWEIVSALVFLHSTKPNPIIHRDLKPENVLLDRDLVSKIGDVGLSTLVPLKDSSSSGTMYKKTGLAGTMFYIDPEYHRTGQVSVKSDTYALGMVILQLLTARSPIGLPELVERAVEDDQLMDVLDEGAGNWPAKEAHDLAQLGLSCLEMRSKNRPDLKNMVSVELERLKGIAIVASGPVQVVPGLGPPSHFLCPILKVRCNTTIMVNVCVVLCSSYIVCMFGVDGDAGPMHCCGWTHVRAQRNSDVAVRARCVARDKSTAA
ncbi:U-box domain-containing protein 35 isoform X3 [Brachypodium distachyon]|uniref:U-box domain-containing protein 35 isoform X3 n=1 Tax=Brachypodium distachyon TaxID=15368 RepID=UPI0001D432A5|nr:U-box domain-containing protein 35 isoform X3 [Brachypodium distachyon]|eukprot:XP_010229350.1 U-box domain-containing protein 35 isoform X3 [Brachypodium distachyon]